MTNVIDLECYRLHDFVDGELRDEDAERFRVHLATCERCAAEMPRLLEVLAATCGPPALSAIEAGHLPVNPSGRYAATTRLPRSRRARLVAAAAATTVILAAAVVLAVWPRTPPGEVGALAILATHRSIEVRLGYAGAAAHRPYEIMRGGTPRQDLPFKQMEALERARDWHGLAVTSLLYGDCALAAQYLERAASSGSVDTDRAALAILDGSDAALDRALALLDAVLATHPDNTAARWNRALGLARLGLPLVAAREFDRVAAFDEPGWSAEATERARHLRTGVEPRRTAWEATDEAGRHWITGEGPIVPPPHAPRGWLRYRLYDAVRAAGTRDRAEALIPIAQQLDTSYGGDTLTRYARAVAGADFRVRAPLAMAFREIALGTSTLQGKALDDLVERTRAAGAMDLWMGIRSHTGTIGQHMADYRAAARATGDPWFALLVEQEQAKLEIATGDRLAAERRLLDAAAGAARDGFEYRHLVIELDLSDLYLTMRRYPEAERHAREALVEAQAAGEWGLEQLVIDRLAETSRFRLSSALSRGYLGEALERAPESCTVRRYVHLALANLAMLALDPVAARRELAASPLCGEPPQLLALLTSADLYRFGGTDAEVRRVREGVAALRTAAPRDPSMLGLADHIEGRLMIEIDRPAGQALLRKAIAEVSGRSDDSSVKTRGHSFSILALDSGRAGEYDAVLAALANELGGATPVRCAVGIAVEDERAIVVIRDADGGLAGEYTTGRSSAQIDARSLLPATLVRRLDGCAEVSVLARPPVSGTPRLLPDTFAWSYHVSGSTARVAGQSGPRLVVADSDPPAYLELPRLRPYSGGRSDTRVLRGSEATPARVISAMRDAAVIEFHTHGFVDRGLSDASFLALTPDTAGRYALTAVDVERSELTGAPLVILAACHGSSGMPFLDEAVGLPLAFVRAGARAVLAHPAVVNDAEAEAFFDAVSGRIAGGASPAAAVRDERIQRARTISSDWSSDVIVYE